MSRTRNPAHTDCLLSMETDNNFYVATSGALPWREPEDTPGDRMRGWWCAGIFVESLLRKAPVTDASQLKDKGCLSSVLSLEYINRWLSVFVDELQLIAAEDGDPDSVRDFKDFDELQLAADQCMDRLTRSNEFPGLVAVEAEVDGSTWDDLEPITGRSSLAWLEGVTLEMLCAGDRGSEGRRVCSRRCSGACAVRFVSLQDLRMTAPTVRARLAAQAREKWRGLPGPQYPGE
ncbi:hypothetical protein AB1Y20_020272 [Prymnesium parvum]|uniref:Uncharacterized protein n=1 Tax=Prymnesium parvum TaxID=97485 RepID=A0AB34JWW0_PRYPA